MFCMNCGTKLPDGAKFCSNCGCKLEITVGQDFVQQRDSSVPMSHFDKLQCAAEQGNVMAQTNLAEAYMQGRGCKKDEEKAIFWYQKAAEQGDEDAVEAVQKLVEKQKRKLAKPEMGKPFFFGEYCGKPIEWKVLTIRGGVAVLLSKYAIDEIEFNCDDENNFQWEDSTLRYWLNEMFYRLAFDEDEKKKIFPQENGDKFILLPPQLFNKEVGVLEENDRFCYTVDGRKCHWWNEFNGSRIVRFTDGYVCAETGSIMFSEGDIKNSDKLGVRPLTMIKL